MEVSAHQKKVCVIRLKREIKEFHKNPPPGIFIAPEESDLKVIHALICGANDTPYESGFFYLVLNFPPNYPFNPPKVKFMTTGGSEVKFHPHIDQVGQIHLDIFRDNWAFSYNISTLLLSIQSVLNEKPYHDEPGYETERVPGDVEKYNEIIRHETLRVAVVGMLDNDFGLEIPERLQSVLRKHFPKLFSYYKAQAMLHFPMNGKDMQDPFGINNGVFDYKTILERLEEINKRLTSLPSVKSTNSTSTSSIHNLSASSLSSVTPTYPAFTVTSSVSLPKTPTSSVNTGPIDGLSATARLKKEIMMFQKDPPPGITIAVDDSDFTVVHALILGPKDTPYDGGFFYFVLRYPTDYPRRPPDVKFMTTAGSRVRFNPNLYKCGRVCLSILGTWLGPSWTPSMNLSTLLPSIQTIFNEKPYHNEPGYEVEQVQGHVEKYNQVIRHETLRVAVVGMLNNDYYLPLPEHLQWVMEKTFLKLFPFYQSQAKLYLPLSGKKKGDPFRENTGSFTYKTILKKLEKLNTKLTFIHLNSHVFKTSTILASSSSSPELEGPPCKRFRYE